MSDRLQQDERLVEALRVTADPPPAWIDAAAQIPATLGDLAAIERLIASQEFRSRFRESPEAAMRNAGLPVSATLVSALRTELA